MMHAPRGRPSDPVLFRPALPSDATAIARLHNLSGGSHWCPEAVLCQLLRRDPRYPILVAVVGADGIHGYCSLTAPDGRLIAEAGIDPDTLAGELATRCLLVVWRQAQALGHRSLLALTATGLVRSSLVLDWEVTDAGFRLDLDEAGPILEAAERRLSMRTYLSSAVSGEESTLPPGFAAV